MKSICTVVLLIIGFSGFCQKLYKTPSGEKYHLGNCHMVNNVSREISLEEAGKLGLTPCKICKPEQYKKQPLLPENKARGRNETVQCAGITKAGTRCKHMTSIANGFCYQHNPDK